MNDECFVFNSAFIIPHSSLTKKAVNVFVGDFGEQSDFLRALFFGVFLNFFENQTDFLRGAFDAQFD